MPITEKQRELRRNHLGSSDVAALFGLDPWKTAYDVWLEKTGKLADNGEAGEAAEAGNYFEDGVLTWAARELGKITRNQYRSRPDLYLGSHIDAIVDDTQLTVESKTGGLFGPLPEPWGEPGTDDVPSRVIVQCNVHMMCAGFRANQKTRLCHVPTFLGGRGFGMFHVPHNDELCEMIAYKAAEFWEEYVEPVKPPPGVLPMLDTIKRVIRVPKKTIGVKPELLCMYDTATNAAKEAKERAERAKCQLLAALGDAERGDGGWAGTCTYYRQKRRDIDATSLRAEQAEIAAKYETTTEYPVLRTQTPKT